MLSAGVVRALVVFDFAELYARLAFDLFDFCLEGLEGSTPVSCSILFRGGIAKW